MAMELPFMRYVHHVHDLGVSVDYARDTDEIVVSVYGDEAGRVDPQRLVACGEVEAVRRIMDVARRHVESRKPVGESWHIDGVRVDAASFLAWEAA